MPDFITDPDTLDLIRTMADCAVKENLRFDAVVAAVQDALIMRAYASCHGEQLAAAQRLGMTKSTYHFQYHKTLHRRQLTLARTNKHFVGDLV